MNIMNTAMLQLYIVIGLLAIAIILLGMWITRDLKHDRENNKK